MFDTILSAVLAHNPAFVTIYEDFMLLEVNQMTRYER